MPHRIQESAILMIIVLLQSLQLQNNQVRMSHKGKGLGESSTLSFQALSQMSLVHYLPCVSLGSPIKKLHGASVSRVLLWFHYVSMID